VLEKVQPHAYAKRGCPAARSVGFAILTLFSKGDRPLGAGLRWIEVVS
jgi:hypothetical protein